MMHYFTAVTFDQLKAGASRLPCEQRKELISFLFAMGREERDVAFRRVLAQKVDDIDLLHWIAVEDLSTRLQLGSEEK